MLAGQRDQDQRRRNELRDDRGKGHAPDAHMEPEHEQQVEHCIQQRGNDQEHQRAGRIPHGAQDAAAHVVEQDARDPGKVDGQVIPRLVPHVFRRLHEAKHRLNDGQADGCGYRADDEGHGDRGMHGQAQPLAVVRAVPLRDDHGRAGRKARTEADDGVDDRTRGAHCRLGRLPHELSDDKGIHHVVQLLKQQAQCHRHGKCQQMPPDAPGGHVRIGSCHSLPRFVERPCCRTARQR